MTIDIDREIVPADFPQLKLLVWNRDPNRAIAAEDVFALYERNWRFVDTGQLTRAESELIADLTQRFGKGRLLA